MRLNDGVWFGKGRPITQMARYGDDYAAVKKILGVGLLPSEMMHSGAFSY